jgi:hypothetical protein
MIRRTLLRLLVMAAIGLSAGMAPADPVDDIIAEIRDQGFTITRVQRTWLGRVRIIGQNETSRREVVIDPTTGEIRRDLLVPRTPPASRPDLGSSRDVGKIGEEPAPPAEDEEGDGAEWGGGWGGSQEAPAEGEGQGEGDADAQ